ncbi:hypothetical protein KALB_6347 [Kutzneria albida DSM 43870]|uniref:Uncharacterized protein n=2 Tax=Kutzneria TaxID=43356 RepID=W5WFV4_9PSEU|nr:hypothetical protein KALB_6347 [Kutzneria albida DSM 43870]
MTGMIEAQDTATELFEALPRGLGALLRPELGSLADEILRCLQRRIPEYSTPLDGPYGQKIRAGVEYALRQFADQVSTPGAVCEDQAELYKQLGRLEAKAGRSLDALQAAYRVGGQLAWRRITEFGQRSRLPAHTIWQLGEAALAYIDGLAALSAEGFAEVRANAAGTKRRQHRRLVRLLLTEQPPPAATLAEVCEQVGWTVPKRVSVVVLQRLDQGRPAEPPAPLVADLDGIEPLVIMPEPEEHPLPVAGLTGWRALVGPSVPLAEAAKSLRQAMALRELVRTGIVSAEDVVRSEDHLSTLWLLSDEVLAKQLVAKRLAPLSGLTDKQSHRLGRTLLAWLETRGGAPEIATRLGIHPQTVRYRMRQVEQLFGEQLRDPTARFELEVALRAAALAAGEPTCPEDDELD